MQQASFRHWHAPFLYVALAITFGALAVWLAPLLAEEPIFPRWYSQASFRTWFSSPQGAVFWLMWRQMRFIITLLLLPVPMLLMTMTLAAFLAHDKPDEMIASIKQNLPLVNNVLPAMVLVGAGLIGIVVPFLEGFSGTDSFALSLPFSRVRNVRLRLGMALFFVLVVTIPAGALQYFTFSFSGDSTLWEFVSHQGLCIAKALVICSLLFILNTLAVSIPGKAAPFAIPGGTMLAVYLAVELQDKTTNNLVPMVIAVVAVTTAGVLLLPSIEARRETTTP